MQSFFTLLLIAAVYHSLCCGEAKADNTYDFGYSGRLVHSSGKPVDGPVSLKVTFFHDDGGRTPILSISQGLENITLQQGIFQFRLALTPSDYDKVFNDVAQPVWIQITDLMSRTRLIHGVGAKLIHGHVLGAKRYPLSLPSPS